MTAVLRKISVTLVMAATIATGLQASSPKAWEEVSTSIPQNAQPVDIDSNISIAVIDDYIYIHSDKPITVKLFSILGQLISQETVKAGTHRIHLKSRGIYILRAGTATRRITI